MNRKPTLALLVLIIALSDCGNSSMEPEQQIQQIQILMNGDVESGTDFPNDWVTGTFPGVLNAYDFSWSMEHSVSPSHSLRISQDTVDDAAQLAIWQQDIEVHDPLAGKELTLMGSIKLENVVGGLGAAIVIRGDDSRLDDRTGAEAIATTHGNINLTGTRDWSVYEVKLELPEGIDRLTVFALLGTNTTGTVYFDDFSLTYE